MYNIIRHNFCKGLVALAGVAVMVSCSDTWNDHYEAMSMNGYDGNLMQAIEEKAPAFSQVIKAVGYDRELNSDNVYTVWAPVDFNKDSLLELAKTDSAAVVDRFIKNHIARYAVSDDGESHNITLLNSKRTKMNATNFGASTLVPGQTNLSCSNGVLHVIDANTNYMMNLYEFIEASNRKSTNAGKDTLGGSLYSFLKIWNADSLDESRSVSRGVDEDGNLIWVDSVTIRNNTVLKNYDAKIYEEDSSYIAIVPSPEAWQKRYEFAKSLLKFNPMEDKAAEGACDSLQKYYANAFAMKDLYFNKNANEHYQDSLKSTNYRPNYWWESVYYSKEPKNMPDDTELNDILSKCGTPYQCSNGEAYLVDEYPMSVYEQFFRKIRLDAQSVYINTDKSTDEKGLDLYTKQVGTMTYKAGSCTFHHYRLEPNINEAGDTVSVDTVLVANKYYPYSYTKFSALSANVNPSVAIQIPNTLSGKYDIYLMTCPSWLDDETGEIVYKPYRFKTNIFERQNSGARVGEYGSAVALTNPENGGSYWETVQTLDPEFNNPTPIDTTYIGEYEFQNAYYGRNDEGVIIQFVSNLTSKMKDTHSRELRIHGIVLKPRDPDAPVVEVPAAGAKSRSTKKYYSTYKIK